MTFATPQSSAAISTHNICTNYVCGRHFLGTFKSVKIVTLSCIKNIFRFWSTQIGQNHLHLVLSLFNCFFFCCFLFFGMWPTRSVSSWGCCCMSRNIFFSFLSSGINLRACSSVLLYYSLNSHPWCLRNKKLAIATPNWFSAATALTWFPSYRAAPPESQRVLPLNILWFKGALQYCPRIFWDFNDLTARI